MQTEALIRQYKNKRVKACLLAQQGELVTTYYKTDEYKDELHKLNSITKSITALLIGIAIDRGDIKSIDLPVSYFFPHIPAEKRSLTLYHLLTMTTGERWEEFGQGVKFPTFFTRSKNWLQYALKRPLVEEPGKRMNYNSGASHVLSAVLQEATGQSTLDFAKKRLFQPLGISDYEWGQDPQGIYIGGFHLKLKTKDLLKIGQLLLQNGKWEGEQLISEDWVLQSTQPYCTTYEHIGSYGFHWWVQHKSTFQVPFDLYFAMGYAGQYVMVVPELQITAAIHSNMPKKGLDVLRIFIEWLREI